MMKVLCSRYIQTCCLRHICTHQITFTHLETLLMMMMMRMMIILKILVTGETKDLEIEKKGGEIQALTSTLETAKV